MQTQTVLNSDSPFHHGEQHVQTLRGVREEAEQRGRKMLTASLQPGQRQFASERPFLISAYRDREGLLWAGLIVGKPGFVRFSSDTEFSIDWTQAHAPTGLRLDQHQKLGLLAIEFENRRRLRINGNISHAEQATWQIEVQQGYGNCPKYIHPQPAPTELFKGSYHLSTSNTLTAEQQAWISNSDHFFIATGSGPSTERDVESWAGLDVSHRGGEPGFIEFVEKKQLWFPDFAGNNMFNTLGNIQRYPFAGLVFINFEAGEILQITARATLQNRGVEGVLIEPIAVQHWQSAR